MAFTEDQIDAIWKKGRIDPKYNPDFVRKDACGAWMIRDKYNDRSNIYGWEIDHIYPKSKLEEMGVPQELIDNIDNLRPLNWHNNVSKGADYPVYHSKMKDGVFENEDGSMEDCNRECDDEKEINETIQQRVKRQIDGYRL